MWDFPGGPVVKIPWFQCRGMGSIPGWETRIPHAVWHGQNILKKKITLYEPVREVLVTESIERLKFRRQ